MNRMREHVLFGNENYDTLQTGCGRDVVHHDAMMSDDGRKQVMAPYYTCGLGVAHREAEFMRLISDPEYSSKPCGTCLRSMRAVYRRRRDKFPVAERGSSL